MAHHRNPVLVAEPREDFKGSAPSVEATPDELKAFYEDAERGGILERKLSKRGSTSNVSTWSRKSLQRVSTAPVPQATSDLGRSSSAGYQSNSSNAVGSSSSVTVDQNSVRSGRVPQLNTSRSVIVDSRQPTLCGDKDAWAFVPQPTFKVSYPLHNPLGPRWYKNHHLIPPSQTKPSMRPPTFFSPSFPPISTSPMGDPGDDDADLSRSPSNSPLPTPNSSQSRVVDKPRSRKTSQTTPDNVDLLDVTDPWGSTWHHTSPYDVFGQTTSYDHPARPRRASMTTVQPHKSIIPSPLSHSTSALPHQPEIHVPRKLSKRKTPAVANIFPSQNVEGHRKAASAPPTPIDHLYDTNPVGDINSVTLPKRMSVVPPPISTQPSTTSKKEKRGSMLGRLVRKFSILKKSSEPTTTAFPAYGHSREATWNSTPRRSEDHGALVHDSPTTYGSRDVFNVPNPTVEPNSTPDDHAEEVKAEEPVDNADKSSIISLELPYSIGRLTVANPDMFDAERPPSPQELPPPPPQEKAASIRDEPLLTEEPKEKEDKDIIIPPQAEPTRPPLEPTISISRFSRFDKPLPPPGPVTPQVQPTPLSDDSSSESDDSDSDSDSDSDEASLQLPSKIDLSPQTTPSLPDKDERPSTPPPKPNGNTSSSSPPANVQQSPTVSPPSPPPTEDVDPQPLTSPPTPTTAVHSRNASQRSTIRSPPPPSKPGDSPVSPVEPEVTIPVRKSSQVKTTSLKPVPSISHPRPQKGRAHSSSISSRNPVPAHASASAPAAQPAVPFPTVPAAQAPLPLPFPVVQELGFSATSYLDSPLSTSSVLANPPTPYDHRLSIAASSDVPPSLPAKDIYEKPPPAAPIPSTSSPTRQTETFKLVRSSSGNVYASGQTIVAAGEQWEVVESPESRRRNGMSRNDTGGSHDAKRESQSREEYEKVDFKRQSQAHRASKQSCYLDDRVPPTVVVVDKHASRQYEGPYEEYEDRRKREDRGDHRHRHEKEERRRNEEREERKRKEEERKRREEREERKRKEEKEERRRREEKELRKRKDEERRAYEEREERKLQEEERRRQIEREERRRREEKEDRKRQEELERKRREHEARRQLEEEERRRREEEEYMRKVEEAKRREEEEARRLEELELRRLREEREERRRREEREERKRQEEYRRQQEEYALRKQQEEEYATRKKQEEEEYLARKRQEDQSRREERRREKGRRSQDEKAHRGDRPKSSHEAKCREDDRRKPDRKSSRKADDRSFGLDTEIVSHTSPYHPFPTGNAEPYSNQVQAVPIPRLERNPSLTARPTSELPSAADMNAMRAKEAWDMERLWKARSMYGLEPDAPINNFIPGPGSTSSKSDDTPEPMYGSLHTAYVVQTPFQPPPVVQSSRIYHSMPAAPPPIIYSSPASIPSIPDSLSSYDPYEYMYNHRTSTATPRGPSALSRPPLNNPLPEPPRESTYEPAPLKPHTRPKSDHWTKYK